MSWLDIIAVKNIMLKGTASHDLDLTGPESIDVNLVFDRTQKVSDTTIVTENNISIRGVNYGNIKLVNENASAVLALSGNMTVIGAVINTSDFSGTCDPNGYRYITQPYLDILTVKDITVTGGVTLDFTGSASYRNEFWVVLNNVNESVFVNTGRIDTLCDTPFDNTATVHLSGLSTKELELLGRGLIRIEEDTRLLNIINYTNVIISDGTTLESNITARSGSSLIFEEGVSWNTRRYQRSADLSDQIQVSSLKINTSNVDELFDFTNNTAAVLQVELNTANPSVDTTISSDLPTCVFGISLSRELILKGTGDYTVCEDKTYYFKEVNTDELLGTWDPSAGTELQIPQKVVIADPQIVLQIIDCDSLDLLHADGLVQVNNCQFSENGLFSTSDSGTFIIRNSSLYDFEQNRFSPIIQTGLGSYLISSDVIRDPNQDVLIGHEIQ